MDPDLRRPVDSVESAKLSSELGILSREYMSIPTSWKNLSDTELMMAMDKLDVSIYIYICIYIKCYTVLFLICYVCFQNLCLVDAFVH